MIDSGTNTPGISAEAFGLPPHTALRYERPAPALRDLLSSYAVLDSTPADAAGTSEWMLPTWAQIWIVLTDAPITVRIGNRRYAPLSSAILYGVTSRAMPVTAQGGVTICIDVSPRGWARLIAKPADLLRDRITPLVEVLPEALVEDLVASVHESDRAGDVQGVLDAVFARHLPAPHPDEALIERIAALIAADTTTDLAAAAAAIGIDTRTLRRVSRRYFGFPPKILTMRVRFLKALTAAMLEHGGEARSGIASYYDASHFLRDAHRFLGMTPRRFLALDTPYLNATLRARRLVLGAPLPALA